MVTELLGEVLGRQRLAKALPVAFASLALLLTVVGLYGVVAQLVQVRTSEIGIRAALGATQRDILRVFVGRALALVSVGTGNAIRPVLRHISLVAAANLSDRPAHDPNCTACSHSGVRLAPRNAPRAGPLPASSAGTASGSIH